MNNILRVAWLIGFVFFAAFESHAVTRYVSPTGGNVYPFDTWQRAALMLNDAINAADSNETVLVATGIYYTATTILLEKGITLQGGGSSASIITTTNQIVLFDVGDDAVIDGFGFHAVSNTSFRWSGIINSGGTVRNCHVSNPRHGINTGSIWMNQGGLFEKSILEGADGTGIFMDHGGMVDKCVIRDCGWITDPHLEIGQYGSDAGGGVFIEHYGTLRNSLIDHNRSGYAGGVFMYIYAVVENCTIVNNYAVRLGGGIAFNHGGEIARNSIIYYNTAGTGAPDAYGLAAGTYANLCSSPNSNPYFGLPPTTPGSVTNEPGFADRPTGNYRLIAGSPCINSGTNQTWMTSSVDLTGQTRIFDELVDMGAYEYPDNRFGIFTTGSPHGNPSPSGITTNGLNTPISAWVNARVFNGATTQYVCRGWIGSGSTPATGSSNRVAFIFKNDSSLMWQWTTNYYLTSAPNSHGTIANGNTWYTRGTTVTLTAVPASNFRFAGWNGDVPPVDRNGNPLALTMNHARLLDAHFVKSNTKIDYNGDNLSDMAVYNPATATWYIYSRLSDTALAFGLRWGFAGSIPVPGDYDNDGRSDVAVFHPASGKWYIRNLEGTVLAYAKSWGYADCVPVPGDYNGDGASDLAVYDKIKGAWYILSLDNTAIANKLNWGFAGCEPVAGDYDGDGISDLALFHPVGGKWYIQTMRGTVPAYQLPWGFTGCHAVPGDYDGDGIDDLAVFSPTDGTWYIRSLNSGSPIAYGIKWGFPGCEPVSGDFDGDGNSDLAVYYPPAGTWYIRTVAGKVLAWNTAWGWHAVAPVTP